MYIYEIKVLGILKSILYQVSKKAKIRNRYNQVPHLTQDTTWESDKNTRKHHIQKCLEVSPFLTGNNIFLCFSQYDTDIVHVKHCIEFSKHTI